MFLWGFSHLAAAECYDIAYFGEDLGRKVVSKAEVRSTRKGEKDTYIVEVLFQASSRGVVDLVFNPLNSATAGQAAGSREVSQ